MCLSDYRCAAKSVNSCSVLFLAKTSGVNSFLTSLKTFLYLIPLPVRREEHIFYIAISRRKTCRDLVAQCFSGKGFVSQVSFLAPGPVPLRRAIGIPPVSHSQTLPDNSDKLEDFHLLHTCIHTFNTDIGKSQEGNVNSHLLPPLYKHTFITTICILFLTRMYFIYTYL